MASPWACHAGPQPDCTLSLHPVAYKALTIVHRYPHNPASFTQGLVFHDGQLYESVGRYGHSALLQLNWRNGATVARFNNHARIFAEGLAYHAGWLFQLSYKAGIVRRFNLELKPSGRFSFDPEGWGLTSNGKRLILSDGSEFLRFYDADDFKLHHKVCVRDHQSVVKRLNELEWVNGKIYANIWLEARMAIIEPNSGYVESYVDLSPLGEALQREGATAANGSYNGIAYDHTRKRLMMTGKLWPALYEVAIE